MKRKKPLILFGLFVVGISLAIFAHVALSAPGDTVFRGNAWSAHTQNGMTRGLGWVVFSSEGTSSQKEIKVYADNSGNIHGGAWANILNDDPTTPEVEENYGWLSFGTSSLGCPDGGPGQCLPKLNRGSGEISGWARFINVTTSTSDYWDGWVKLRNNGSGPKYGVCWGNSEEKAVTVGASSYFTGEKCKRDGLSANGKLTGMMWGGTTIGGWIVFTEGAPSGLLTITPSWPIKVAIFEKADYSANQDVSWAVGVTTSSATIGGNMVVGTISPTSTPANIKSTYSALSTARKVFVVAKNDGGDTASAEIEVTAPYRLNTCTTNTTTSLNIDWSALYGSRHAGGEYPSYADHRVYLLGKGVPKGNPAPTLTISDRLVTKNEGSDFFNHVNLSTSTDYYYRLETTYTTPASFTTTTSVLGPCQISPPAPISDIPSRTKAFALDARTIMVNWKDNTTTTSPYRFDIQRIKLTPASSTKFVATTTKADYVRLLWSNITTSTPFYHELERSTTTATYRFNQNPRAGTIDPTFNKQDVNGWNSISLMANPQSGNVDFNDRTVNEATTYYYRVRTCSTIDPDKAYNRDTERGLTEKPNPVCSNEYASILGPGRIDDTTISTTTPPYTPTNTTSTATWDGSRHKITLRWNDNSKRETGYRIFRDGVLIEGALGASPSGTTSTMTYVDDGVTNSLGSKAPLSSDRDYSYEIQAYYDYPENGGGRVYSDKATTGTHTYFEVQPSILSSGSGSISGDVSCSPGSCLEYFSWYTTPSITLNASAAEGYYFSTWTGVSCICSPYNPNCNKQTSCTISRGDSYPVATFEKMKYTLSVNVNGNGRVTGNGISCPTNCSKLIDYGDAVALSASPVASSTFTAWGGACSGTSTTCNFIMSSDRSVSASFSVIVTIKNLFANISDSTKNLFGSLFEARNTTRDASQKATIIESIQSGIKNIFGSVGYVIRGIRDEFARVVDQVERVAEHYIAERATTAEGRQYAPGNLDNYYNTFNTSSTVPSYKDINLEPNTVYMYRVRVTYIGETNRSTEWDLPGAAKTLSNTGGTGTTNHGICVQNSYCDFTVRSYKSTTDITRIPPTEESEEQCTTNSQCRDVGRGGQSYQER